VICTDDECEVTLGGSGSQARVFGTWIALEHVDTGRATLRVGDVTISCAAGDVHALGRVELVCTSVDATSVQMLVTRN
jgi:hypothetical protein